MYCLTNVKWIFTSTSWISVDKQEYSKYFLTVPPTPIKKKCREDRKSYHNNPENGEWAEASGVESDVDEEEFELNVGAEEVISRLQSMNKSFQFRRATGDFGGRWRWRNSPKVVN